MAHFILQPCHLREGKFAPIKGTSPKVFTWAELVEALAPSKETRARMTLRRMQPGAYVGTAKDRNDAKMVRNFLLVNQNRSSQLEWVLKKDPTFENRLISVYRVDEVKWEGVVHEFDTPGRMPWV